MNTLRLQSERFRPEGGIDARGRERALGIPTNIDFGELFLRETLQNSWDARADDGPVRFSIDARVLTPTERAVLRDVVFQHCPPKSGPGVFLPIERLDVLIVSDSGTRGLNGPTRADVPCDPEESNFVDLVRNAGRDEAKGYAAGTYGFGKAVLWKASTCGTVLMYSRTTQSGRPVSRLIATALGVAYDQGGVRYTGRHWWGAEGTGTVEPLENTAADELATALGLAEHLPAGATGTSLMIMTPFFDDAPLEDVIAHFANAATAYAWPHMVSTAVREPDIEFGFICNGRPFVPPDPAVDPRTRYFVDAYRRCEDLLAGRSAPHETWPWTVAEIRSQRPARRLGVIAHRDYPHIPDGSHDLPPADIALMRNPRLVVRYLPVKPAPTGQATVGVFIACPTLDEQFAASEPATHDDWRTSNAGLARNQRNPVRQAIDQIKNRFRRHLASVRPSQASYHAGAVSISSRLGRILDGAVTGTDTRIAAFPSTATHPAPQDSADGGLNNSRGAGEPSGASPTVAGPSPDSTAADATSSLSAAGETPPGAPYDRSAADTNAAAGPWRTRPARPGRRTQAVLEPVVRILRVGGVPAVEFTAEITVAEGSAGALIVAEPYVLVDGGRETEPPIGAEVPRVLSWREEATDREAGVPSVRLTQPGTTRWRVTVAQPGGTAISMRLDVRELRS